ncbi:MAG: CRTAC1 family protein [Balneolaceae bacterium]
MDSNTSNSGTRTNPLKFRLPGLFILAALLLFSAHFIGWIQLPGFNQLSQSSGSIQLEDVTPSSGLEDYTRAPIYRENPGYIEVMGGGVAVGDVNGDGWEDIFFAGMPSFHPDADNSRSPSALFLNNQDGTFSESTTETGLDGIKGLPMGALFFDFNNNGRQDLYVAAYNGGQLFRNDGGTFTDITDSAGVNLEGLCGDSPCLAATASTADYNRNGFLDLLIVNNVEWDEDDPMHYGRSSLLPANFEGQPSVLFRNNGDGTFTNVTEKSGVLNRDDRGHREAGKGLAAIWTDINNDGWPDIYFANDMSPNRLYLNNGDSTFTEIGISAQIDEFKSSMGLDAADFNLNGNMDLVVTNLEGQMISLFRNYANLRFDYVTFHTGIMKSTRSSGWGIVFVDLNLDGFQDLVMGSGPIWEIPEESENLFYRNLRNGKFEEVTDKVVNFSNRETTRGLAVIDMNQSGKPDLIFSNIDGAPSQLLKNETSGNNWVRLDLEGTVSNRDAIGTRVTLERADGVTQNQIVIAGNSYLSSGSKSLFFGLGKSRIQQMTIQWPSGRTDVLDDPGINEILHIKEGENPDEEVVVQSRKPETAG